MDDLEISELSSDSNSDSPAADMLVAIYREAHQGRDDSQALFGMLADIKPFSDFTSAEDIILSSSGLPSSGLPSSGLPSSGFSGYFGWVGITEQQPAGFMLCRVLWAQQPVFETELVDIAVHPDYQGHSIGFHLLSHALTQINKLGASGYERQKMFLEVAETNFKARKLYEKTGFIEVGRRKNYSQSAAGGRVDGLTYSWCGSLVSSAD
ncbi:MAG: GNAT family N-acetyltransferase [Candidatus Puniceispirillaceae bacterium]